MNHPLASVLTQVVAEAHVRELGQELKSEKDIQASTAHSGLQTGREGRIVSWRWSVPFSKARRARAAAD